MPESIFLRLLAFEDKAAALAEAVEAVSDGRELKSVVHQVDPESFHQVPGSPYAYWVSERIRRLFTEFPPFESDGRTVKQGLATADDFRFVRCWWEALPDKTVAGTIETIPEQFRQQTFEGKRWVPFAKGGAYSPYYADIHLVLDWERGGERIRNFERAFIRNEDFYFRPGLTWPLRTSGLSFRTLPVGCIFGHKGPVAFFSGKRQEVLLSFSAVVNSLSYYTLVQPLVARVSLAQSFEVGLIQSIPVPDLSNSDQAYLKNLVSACIAIKRNSDCVDESSHIFLLSAILQIAESTLAMRSDTWQAQIDETKRELAEYRREIDDFAFKIYGIDGEDRQAIEDSLNRQHASTQEESEADIAEDDTEAETSADAKSLVADLISYSIGCAFGRWDVRFATGERQAPELPDPFAPLPVCSPGMLQGDDGLPLRDTPAGYPLDIDWDGILVDEPTHKDDIIRRTQDALELIFKDRAESIEREAAEILGVKQLRDYFRKPAGDGFWMYHVKRYSKSRRKAPIYWLLQSAKKNYALWLYYHRLDKDMLFKALINYVEPKLRLEENLLEQTRSRRAANEPTGREAKQIDKQIEQQESFLSELRDFHDKLRRAADLRLEPDLNDGVVLNIAPLWELVPWAEAKKYWQELLQGKYEWSSISKQLRERGIVKA